MIRSLRLRFFLIVWPLVVGAVVGVGWYFGRWTRLEVRREAVVTGSVGLSSAFDSLGAWIGETYRATGSWAEVEAGLDAVPPESEEAQAKGVPMDAVVVDGTGRVLARSDPSLSLLDVRVDADGLLRAAIRGSEGGVTSEDRVRVTGLPLDVEAESPIRVYAVPRLDRYAAELLAEPELNASARSARAAEAAEARDDPGFVAAADRAILLGVALASGLAALATLGLARLVTGPVRQLALAARRIREGDLTARVPELTRDELGDVVDAFNDMAGQLERSEALKRRMISDAAHELRTPLTNVLGGLEALEDGLREPTPAALRSLTEEARLLQRIVEDLQDIAVADSGALHLHRDDFDLGEAAADAVEAFRPLAAEREIILVVEGHGSAHADRHRMGQVIRNLVHNAIAHTPPGGQVWVRVDPSHGGTVSVEDEGSGIPEADLELVWERFYRVEGSRSRGSGGTGLGLPIVKRLVEAHGGTVDVASEPGVGSRFTVRLAAGR